LAPMLNRKSLQRSRSSVRLTPPHCHNRAHITAAAHRSVLDVRAPRRLLPGTTTACTMIPLFSPSIHPFLPCPPP